MSKHCDMLRYACKGMIERNIATGHADSMDQAIDVLFEAYDEKRAQLAEAERERDESRAEKYELLLVLERHGFRRCDIPACNCGSWHQVGGFAERFREIEEVTEGYYRNGETLLDRITRIVQET